MPRVHVRVQIHFDSEFRLACRQMGVAILSRIKTAPLTVNSPSEYRYTVAHDTFPEEWYDRQVDMVLTDPKDFRHPSRYEFVRSVTKIEDQHGGPVLDFEPEMTDGHR